MKKPGFSLLVKVILLQILFLILHFMYDWAPSGFTALVSSTNESVYQHMKVAFIVYLCLSLVEFAVFHRRIGAQARFLQTHALVAVLFPLLVIPWYYMASAYCGRLPAIWMEILFANLATLLVSLTALQIEQHLANQEFNPGLKRLTLGLFLVTLSEFVIFNYRLPWLDLFAAPPGW